ncbi:MAG TPA: FkbM family methyltransferase [Planctomycetota bacterium]|nr:FkbM family methyltransferase [Planctomycetota bacterium]
MTTTTDRQDTPDRMRFFSQFGEDRLLAEIFSGIGGGTCVEVGGNDGILNSNTYHFELIGWTTVVVEPIPWLCERIALARPRATVICRAAAEAAGQCEFHVAVGADGMSSMADTADLRGQVQREGAHLQTIRVETETLDRILERAKVDDIHFLTIDVEGAEMRVLRGLDLARWKPRIVIVEDNSHGRDGTVVRHLRQQGYANVHRTGVNDWFITETDRELASRFDIATFQRRRSRLWWRYRAGRLAQCIMPAFLRRRLKRLVGGLPFHEAGDV